MSWVRVLAIDEVTATRPDGALFPELAIAGLGHPISYSVCGLTEDEIKYTSTSEGRHVADLLADLTPRGLCYSLCKPTEDKGRGG